MPPDPHPSHEELAAHLTGRLADEEEARFAAELASSDALRREAAELEPLVGALRRTAPSAPSSDLKARTLAAIAALPDAAPSAGDAPAAAPDELAEARARRRPATGRLLAAAAVALAALVVAFAVGRATGPEGGGSSAGGPLPGQEEKRATLRGGGVVASTQVNLVAEGRLVSVRSDDLPVVPAGTFYELWFVAPGDSPRTPRRISAGTWHPAPDGRTDVRFLIAADPARYPRIEVTRETDADAAPGTTVLREG